MNKQSKYTKEGFLNETLDKIELYARTLQKGYCCYGTTEGDNRTCDCKFAKEEFNSKNRYQILFDGCSGGESTGCCEARQIIWLLKDVRDWIEGYKQKAVEDFIQALLDKQREEIVEDLEAIEDQFIHTDERYGSVKSIHTQLENLIDKYKYTLEEESNG